MTAAPAQAFGVGRMARWGTLWGLTVAIAESLIATRGANASPELSWLPWIVLYMVPVWCVTGFLLAVCASRAETLFGVPGAVIAWFAASIVVAVVYVALSFAVWRAIAAFNVANHTAILPAADRWLATPLVFDALIAYHTWTNLFFGGFLCAAVVLEQRSERVRSLLHIASMARERTAALVVRVQIESFRAQVDPQLVSETLDDIRRAYRVDAHAAEALLDALVAFLRAAMHGLRERDSTLGQELELARSLAALQSARRLPRGWTVAGDLSEPEAALPFPTQVLLPLLACADPRRQPSLAVAAGSDRRVRLLLRGLRELPEELARDLALRLRALDPRWTVVPSRDATDPVHALEFAPG